jgi:hypothetical protein
MGTRRTAEMAGTVPDISDRLAALEAENAALARAVVRIAVSTPGGPATAQQILAHQLRLTMPTRWLPGDPAPVISSACGRDQHASCQTPHCGCLCHEPGGAGSRHQ